MWINFFFFGKLGNTIFGKVGARERSPIKLSEFSMSFSGFNAYIFIRASVKKIFVNGIPSYSETGDFNIVLPIVMDFLSEFYFFLPSSFSLPFILFVFPFLTFSVQSHLSYLFKDRRFFKESELLYFCSKFTGDEGDKDRFYMYWEFCKESDGGGFSEILD